MNITSGKYLGLLALVIGLTAGCATAPEEEPPAEPEGCGPEVQQAINAARDAFDEAESLDWKWKSSEGIIEDAQAAADAGNCDEALRLAEEAEFQANEAVNQYYLEQAKMKREKIAGYGGLTGDQQARVDRLDEAIRNAEGRRAYDLASALLEELQASRMTYEVVRGDNLWDISAKSRVYDDPYRWPLIYKANQDKIRDADLIHPGQRFQIDRNPTRGEVDAAVEHAKTRGSWSIGDVEQSDRDYLSR